MQVWGHNGYCVPAVSCPRSLCPRSLNRANYIRRKAIGYVYFHDDEKNGDRTITIYGQKTETDRYPDSLVLTFKTDEERQKAFDALNIDPTKPKPLQIKKPGPT